jgi:hypothetical protein
LYLLRWTFFEKVRFLPKMATFYQFLDYRKTPLLVQGIDPFSNANIYALDQLIAETETDSESTT